MIKKCGLTKKERISSKKGIDLLFTEGSSFIAYPLRIVYIKHNLEEITNESDVSIIVSVSKKKFKRAVKRNRLKRLIKESYRLNKSDFIEKITYPLSIAFLYLPDEEKSYIEIESAVQKALETLLTRIQSND